MAKKSMVARDKKRIKMIAKFAAKCVELKKNLATSMVCRNCLAILADQAQEP